MKTIASLDIRVYKKSARKWGSAFVFTSDSEKLKNDANYLGVISIVSNGNYRAPSEDRVAIVYLDESLLAKTPATVRDFFSVYCAEIDNQEYIEDFLRFSKKYPQLFENIKDNDFYSLLSNFRNIDRKVYEGIMQLNVGLSMQSRYELALDAKFDRINLKDLEALYSEHRKNKKVTYKNVLINFRKVRDDIEQFYIACEEKLENKASIL